MEHFESYGLLEKSKRLRHRNSTASTFQFFFNLPCPLHTFEKFQKTSQKCKKHPSLAAVLPLLTIHNATALPQNGSFSKPPKICLLVHFLGWLLETWVLMGHIIMGDIIRVFAPCPIAPCCFLNLYRY